MNPSGCHFDTSSFKREPQERLEKEYYHSPITKAIVRFLEFQLTLPVSAALYNGPMMK